MVEEGCGDDGGCTPLLSHPLPPEPSSLCPCTLDFIGICFQKKAAPHPTPPPLSLSPPLSSPLSLSLSLPVFGSLNFPPEKSPKRKRERKQINKDCAEVTCESRGRGWDAVLGLRYMPQRRGRQMKVTRPLWASEGCRAEPLNPA